MEENDRVGRTRDLFKKTGDVKGTFHARMGTIKHRKCMGLTEGEEIKERWREDTEVLSAWRRQKCNFVVPNPGSSDTSRLHHAT